MQHYTLNDLKVFTSQLDVLYVEDEPFLREGMVKSLNQLFKTVTVAEDGFIGLYLYKKEHFDLIITDISMPNMDGITMIAHIKEIDQSARIIVTSAQNDSDKLLTLINLGVDRFLTKPIQKALLIEGLYVVCSSVVNAIRADKYQKELESKIRILNTQLKKEYVKSIESAPAAIIKAQAYEDYFEQIFPEDIDELRDLNDEIDYNLLLAFQNNRVNLTYISHVAKLYERYSSIFSRYHAFSALGTGLYTMAQTFLSNKDGFIEHASALYELLEGFNFTLITLRINVLETYSSKPTFYNASLLSDITMIENRLNNVECESNIEFF